MVVPENWELCCGSAGTYNVERPEIAAELGARKAGNPESHGRGPHRGGEHRLHRPDRAHLRALGRELPVMHTVQVLDRAYLRRRGVAEVAQGGGGEYWSGCWPH